MASKQKKLDRIEAMKLVKWRQDELERIMRSLDITPDKISQRESMILAWRKQSDLIIEALKNVVSDDLKNVPKDATKWIEDNPSAWSAIVDNMRQQKANDDRLSIKRAVEDARGSSSVSVGSIKGIYGSYFARYLVRQYPGAFDKLQMEKVGYLCQWEEGYEEFMASDETDLEVWLVKTGRA